MLFTFPSDALVGQHVMIAGDTKTDSPVLPVRIAGILKRIHIEVNDIVQDPDCKTRESFKLRPVVSIDVAKYEGGEIADYESPRMRHRHKALFPVYVLQRNIFHCYLAHVLRDLGAEVG